MLRNQWELGAKWFRKLQIFKLEHTEDSLLDFNQATQVFAFKFSI